MAELSNLSGLAAARYSRQDMENKTLAAQTEALETMGRIAGQPGERALREAQARAQNALAEQNEAEAMARAVKARLGAGYSRQLQERGTGPLGSPMQGDAATALENEANWMEGQGAPREDVNKLRVQAVELRQKTRAGEESVADAAFKVRQAQKLEQDAMLQGIQYAGSSPEAHANSWPKLNAKGSPLAGALTGNFTYDRQIMAQYALGSLTEDQKINNAIAVKKYEIDKAQLATQQTTADTTNTVAKKRVELLSAQLERIQSGGVGTATEAAAKETLAYAKYLAQVTARENEYPAAYRNIDKLVLGKTYTLKDSSLGILVEHPTEKDKVGNPLRRWLEIKPAIVSVKPPRTEEQILAARRNARVALEEE